MWRVRQMPIIFGPESGCMDFFRPLRGLDLIPFARTPVWRPLGGPFAWYSHHHSRLAWWLSRASHDAGITVEVCDTLHD